MGPILTTMGALATRAWLAARGLDANAPANWYVEVVVATDAPGARLELNLYPEEWGYIVRIGGATSSIRITDVPFVHGVDQLRVLTRTPALDQITTLLAEIESGHGVQFDRQGASVQTNLEVARATGAVRAWLAAS